MEKKRKLIQVYALIVCIVAIITFIICISRFPELLSGIPSPPASRGELISEASRGSRVGQGEGLPERNQSGNQGEQFGGVCIKLDHQRRN